MSYFLLCFKLFLTIILLNYYVQRNEFVKVLWIKYGKGIAASNFYLFKSVPTDSTKFRLTPNSHVQVLKLLMVETVFLWYRIVIHKSIINLKCMLAFFKKLFLSAFFLKDGDIELNHGPNNWSHFHFPCCQ